MHKIQVRSRAGNQFLDITSRVREAIADSKVHDGIAVVHFTHTTAGITINEAADPAVVEEVMGKLSRLRTPRRRLPPYGGELRCPY